MPPPNQMDGPNALSTPSSAASSNLEEQEMWIKSWIHSCSTLPQQCCPAELFFERKPWTTLDLLLPTKQPMGRALKMECQFNRRHGAVECNLDGGDPVCVRYHQSHDWMAGSVAKRIWWPSLHDASQWIDRQVSYQPNAVDIHSTDS